MDEIILEAFPEPCLEAKRKRNVEPIMKTTIVNVNTLLSRLIAVDHLLSRKEEDHLDSDYDVGATTMLVLDVAQRLQELCAKVIEKGTNVSFSEAYLKSIRLTDEEIENMVDYREITEKFDFYFMDGRWRAKLTNEDELDWTQPAQPIPTIYADFPVTQKQALEGSIRVVYTDEVRIYRDAFSDSQYEIENPSLGPRRHAIVKKKETTTIIENESSNNEIIINDEMVIDNDSIIDDEMIMESDFSNTNETITEKENMTKNKMEIGQEKMDYINAFFE